MGKQQEHARGREVWAVVLVGFALILFLSLVSYNKADDPINTAASGHREVQNFIGPVGAWIGVLTFSTFGLGAYVLMMVLAGLGAMLLLGKETNIWAKIGASLLLLVSASCILHLAGFRSAQRALNLPGAGGFIGVFFVDDCFRKFLGTAGTWIIFGAAYLVSLILLINLRPSYWAAITVGAAVREIEARCARGVDGAGP